MQYRPTAPKHIGDQPDTEFTIYALNRQGRNRKTTGNTSDDGTQALLRQTLQAAGQANILPDGLTFDEAEPLFPPPADIEEVKGDNAIWLGKDHMRGQGKRKRGHGHEQE